MLSPNAEEERPSCVVCVHHERSWAWARMAVFSSHTMEWHILPETGTLLLEGDSNTIATVVSGFICWGHKEKGCILVLSTETFQFSIMDLPSPLKFPLSSFMLGQTKDGKLCIVHVHECKLVVWLRTVEDGVEGFMLHKVISLCTAVKEVTERPVLDNADVRLMTIINGFVYLSVFYWKSQSSDSEWFLSICLETTEVNLPHKAGRRWYCPVDPYIMTSWPSSLTHNKDLETGVTGGISEDDGPMGTQEACHILLTALRSFKETLIDDDKVNFMEMDAFLLDDEMNSLVKRITTLESGLAAARDSILRIGGDYDNRKEMERRSWWQMWTAGLGRACSRFFTS